MRLSSGSSGRRRRLEAVPASSSPASTSRLAGRRKGSCARLARESSRAADAARHRIERDLHDGAQQRLVTVALALRIAQKELQDGRVTAVAERLETIGAKLEEALADLRDLARGIHPAVEATVYCVVAEALTNVAKYAEARVAS